MPSNSYPIIAKEGWLFIGVLIVLLTVAYYYLGNTATGIAATLLVITLFLLRDPGQKIASSPLAIVSPVFGKIISVDDDVEDPWVSRRAKQIRIKIRLLDIYSIRSPIEGKIVNQWTRRPDGENNGRRFAFRVRSDEGDEIVVVTSLNFLTAFFFKFYVHSGERLGHGQRCGYLYFGGMVDVLVPKNSSIRVESGTRVNSGSDVIAQLVHTGCESVIKPREEPVSQS